MERIGVAGLGKMGTAMAARWASEGVPVAGWTRRGLGPDRARALGIAAAPDLAALAAGADIIVTSLSDDAAVTAVIGALADLDLRGKLVVETSTVSPETARALAADIARAGGAIVDAPISGGPEMVAAGTAGVFAGGAAADVDRFRPLARHIARNCAHVGPLGQGLSMKIVNNMVIAGMLRAIHDALAVGARSGLGLPEMLAVLLESPVATPFLQSRAALIRGEEDRVGFSVEQALGDMAVFLDEAARLGVDAPAVAGFLDAAREMAAAGKGDRDVAAILRAATQV